MGRGIWGGEGAYKKQRHICKLPFSTFRSLLAVFSGVNMRTYVRESVGMYVGMYVCVCASMFSGVGRMGGGFCNVFYRKRTQVTFNWQYFWRNSRGLCAYCNFRKCWGMSPSLG